MQTNQQEGPGGGEARMGHNTYRPASESTNPVVRYRGLMAQQMKLSADIGELWVVMTKEERLAASGWASHV